MAELQRIIKVNITRQTTGIDQMGFGTMLAIAPLAEKPLTFIERVRVYSSLSGVLEDFPATTQTYLAAQAHFGQNLSPERFYIGFMETGETIAEALTAIKQENDDWYAVGLVEIDLAVQMDLAAYIQTDCRVAVVRTNDANALTTDDTDIGSFLTANGYSKTLPFYNEDASTEYSDFAFMGGYLPREVGSATLKFKSAAGITADSLTETERTNLTNSNYNFYTRFGGRDIVEEGVTGDGSFFDEIRSTDFIQSRIQEAIYSQLINLAKIPFTNQGFNLIENQILGVLNLSVEQGILRADPAPFVTIPSVLDIPFNDRAERCLTGITFTAFLQGAVHKVCIQGTVTV